MLISSHELTYLIKEEAFHILYDRRLIREANRMSRDTFGISPSKYMSLQEQMSVVNELGPEASSDNVMNAMILCSLVKATGLSKNKEPLNEVGPLAILAGGYQVLRKAKFWQSLLAWAGKKLPSEYNKAMKDLSKEAEAACAPEQEAADTEGDDEVAPWDLEEGANPEMSVKACTRARLEAMKAENPEKYEALKKNIIQRTAVLFEKMLAWVEEKFRSLCEYIAAVLKFKTLKPSEEQKAVARKITDKIIVYINFGIVLTSLGIMAASGGWVAVTLAGIFMYLSKKDAMGKLLALKKMPDTVEEAQGYLERAKKGALEAVMQEAA